ncbi:amidohydrolase 2 [Aspergillus sclerotiicarbonarius CBS 121057]|uniref:Amidohydrolase 2 n=1 Tax=Aspergillus sclerotiicarbonarius (strain CBS 121057 / IBT 28362) TaxID=1448318 RepID=A0A319EGS5_ASPSB|nr:amidohydrolase 2 [Aspergillus sclerotiicarbonarius CBS 121057]
MSSQPMNSHGGSSNTLSLLPNRAVDTHVHVFDPKLGPYAASRAYTPTDAPLEKLIAFNQTLSTDSKNNILVLVQPSPYKNDCSVLLHCLRELKNRDISAFGIAVLDLDNTTDAQLKEMHTLGVRGIRLNFQADGNQVRTAQLVSALYRTADRIRYLPGWVIQLFVPGWTWDVLHDAILELPVRVIADHLGGMLGSSKLPPDVQLRSTCQPGFDSLLSLAKKARVFVKMAGLYRMSNDSAGTFGDLQPIVQTFAQEIPDQLIWGSDWPHTGDGHNRVGKSLDVKEPFRIVDDHAILRRLHSWVGDDVYRKMLVDNPGRLYLN